MTKKNFSILLLVFLANFLVVNFSSAAVNIVPTSPNKLAPNRIIVEGKPGTDVTENFTLNNNSKDNVAKVNISVVDGFITEDGKNMKFKTYTDEQVGIGKWASSDIADMDLQPMEKKIGTITFKIPENTEKKTYFGGIILKQDGWNDVTKSDGVKFNMQFAQQVELRVTDTPQIIEKLPPSVLVSPSFNPGQIWLMASVVLFVLVIGYYGVKYLLLRKKTHKTRVHHGTDK